ncbi:MAG: o-succinylbenzoate synthase [Bacteroidales bacterium]|jgi:o-succinylbenzoate synthase
MIKAISRYHTFEFQQPAVTSRGTLLKKTVHYIMLYNTSDPATVGIGECSLFPGLSMDDVDHFTGELNKIIDRINNGRFNFKTSLHAWPSINFALETALKDLECNGTKILYPSAFTQGKDPIPINGLIWMNDKKEMSRQIKVKLKEGFRCLKLKIGAISFDDEYEILSYLRNKFSKKDLEIRVDANGAFSPKEAPGILNLLAELEIHSIEQPILPSQLEEMAVICENSPLPVALDEELIGKYPFENKLQLLKLIKPHYIVLKPGILGGIRSCNEWIKAANQTHTGWWITSSLETNIGLNAIAQWTYTLENPVHHGLSTGTLFKNNVESPIALNGEKLYYFPHKKWDLGIFTSNS